MVNSGYGRLHAIVHIPFYVGEKLNLYRYVPTPNIVKSEFLVTVSGEYEYIALDDGGTMAKEFATTEIQACMHTHGTYHCPERTSARKDMRHMCLYALFHVER